MREGKKNKHNADKNRFAAIIPGIPGKFVLSFREKVGNSFYTCVQCIHYKHQSNIEGQWKEIEPGKFKIGQEQPCHQGNTCHDNILLERNFVKHQGIDPFK